MATPAQKTKVGAFLLMCATLFIGGVFLISGYNTETKSAYRLEFEESILGLGQGGLVEYLGVPVGAVKDIYVDDEGHAQVLIEVIDSKATLREGVSASLRIYSFATGTMAIELQGGGREAPKLPENSHIPVTKSLITNFTTLAENLLKQFEAVLADIGEISKSLKLAMAGMEEGAIAKIVEDAGALVTNTNEMIVSGKDTLEGMDNTLQQAISEYTKLGKDLRRMAEDFGRVVSKVETFVDTATAKVEPLDIAQIQADLERSLKNIADFTERLDGTMVMVTRVGDTVMNQTDNLENSIRNSLLSLTEAVDGVTDLVEQLKEDPASIIRGRGAPKEPGP